MHSCEMIKHSIRNVIVSTSFTSPVAHLFPKVFSWYVSVPVLINVSSLIRIAVLASAIGDHASSHTLLLRVIASVAILMISVLWRLIFIPFGEVGLAMTIMCWWLSASLRIVIARIIILKGSSRVKDNSISEREKSSKVRKLNFQISNLTVLNFQGLRTLSKCID